ncbi:hypothetical protein Tco_1176813 [Tanacetum coccineum]
MGGLSQGFWSEVVLTSCYLFKEGSVSIKGTKLPLMNSGLKKPNLNYLRVWGCRTVVRLPDPKLKTFGERDIECIFVRYAKHSKAFRFFVIEPNDSVTINSIIESKDAIFGENRFSSVLRPSLRIPNKTEDIGGSDEVTKEVVQQLEPELRKNKRNKNPKNFGPEFKLYLIKGTRDEVSDQHSYCFNVKDDPKTFDEAMKSQDVAFWKELINDEMDSIMGNNTWVLADLPLTFLNGDLEDEVYMNQPQGFIMPGNENKVDLTKDFLSSKFSMKDVGEADVILGIRIKHKSNGITISQSYYIEKGDWLLNVCHDLYKAGYYFCCSYTDASWISNTEDNSSTSGWVFLLGGGAISWASKKQTCITSSTMESKFVALATAGKEAEWLKNLLLEISL